MLGNLNLDGHSLLNALIDAELIKSGVLSADRIPILAKSKISTYGTWLADEIPSLDASKITSGVLDLARIPTLLIGKAVDTLIQSEINLLWEAVRGGATILYSGARTYLLFPTVYTNKAIKAIILGVPDNASTARGRILVGRFSDTANFYYINLTESASSADHTLEKVVGGSSTVLGTEAINLTTTTGYTFKLSCGDPTIKSYREDMVTAKISATDTSLASGKFGLLSDAPQQHNINVVECMSCTLESAGSPTPKTLGYFEAPVIGSGKEDDPFRVNMPQELDIQTEEGRINKLALSYSSLIKTDKATGKPKEYTAIVRIFEQLDRPNYMRSIATCLDSLRAQAGVKELDQDKAKIKAKQIDDLLTDEDLKEWD